MNNEYVKLKKNEFIAIFTKYHKNNPKNVFKKLKNARIALIIGLESEKE